ncbi:hypothetical protein [Nocardioides sp.]|uniref:hypothetical protein n=1 Tax=Nocardioides sp. TaxID=35761 RepID=UPI003D0DF9DD
MKNLSLMVSATAIVAGVGGGAVAYQAVSSTPETVAVATTTDHRAPAPQVTRPGVEFRFAPCKAPATREGKACVVDVVQTVVIPAAPSSNSPQAPATEDSDHGPRHHESSDDDGDDTPAQTHEDDGDDDQGEAEDHEGEDHGEDHGNDGQNEPGDD